MDILRNFGGQGLAVGHLGEFAVEVVEGVVVAALDYAALFEDVDGVAVSDGGETVGYDDDGLVSAQGVYAALDLGFGFGVEGAGGFVEDEKTGVFVEFAAMEIRCRWPPEMLMPLSPRRES